MTNTITNNLQTSTVQAPVKGKSRFVNYLALTIIVLSGLILVILVSMAWLNLTASESFNNTEKLFTILLPVIGTWMGTILAFYFSKDNFEAANQQVKEMVNRMNPTDEKLQEMKAGDVMIKLDTSILMTVKDENAFKEIRLDDLLKKMEDSHSERMPVLQEGTLKFTFLIYRTTIERFIIGVANGAIKLNPRVDNNGQPIPPPAPRDLTVKDMFESDFKLIKDLDRFKGCFMPATATLDQVKKAMQDNALCQDVFITTTGKSDEPVDGWITNNLIIEKAELFRNVGAKV